MLDDTQSCGFVCFFLNFKIYHGIEMTGHNQEFAATQDYNRLKLI